MSRESAIARAERYFASGDLKRDLARRVAMPTENQNSELAPALICSACSSSRHRASKRDAA